MATTVISGASFSKDETRLLFSSDESGIVNVYVMPVGGGKPAPMTRSTIDSTNAVGYFYNDDRILFRRDNGGNEHNHSFVRELDGTEKDLTPGDKAKASFAGWRPDGNAFYGSTNECDPKFLDLYRYDANTYARSMVYKNETGFNISAISRDERWLALQKTITTSDSDSFLYNVATRVATNITPHSTPASRCWWCRAPTTRA